MAQITLMGKAVQTNSDIPEIGATATDFVLTQNSLKDISLSDLLAKAGKEHALLSIVPSLDTDVCATSLKTLEQISGHWPQTQFLLISADLPFAQQRFCAENAIKKVKCLSEMRNKKFAKDYGVHMQDGPMAGLMARAIFIISHQKIIYQQLVTEITEQPDYTAMEAALEKL